MRVTGEVVLVVGVEEDMVVRVMRRKSVRPILYGIGSENRGSWLEIMKLGDPVGLVYRT
jgi:hypothetical protein